MSGPCFVIECVLSFLVKGKRDRELVAFLLNVLFDLILYVPVNNISVMLRRVFLS